MDVGGEAAGTALKVSMIGCPFQTTYGAYIASLREALQDRAGSPVQWVASNCGCGDPLEEARQFHGGERDYFEMPSTIGGLNIVGYSPNRVKRALKAAPRSFGNAMRVARYADLALDADVIHLQQTLGAFGSDIAFRLLQRRIGAARIVTVHELDPEQCDFPARNRAYNLADALIVHDSLMKQKLVALDVEADRIHVVRCGTDLAEGRAAPRAGIVFYGGHNLNKSKGLDTLLQAYRRLKDDLGAATPRLRIHGHFGRAAPKGALDLATRHGVVEDIDWLNELSTAEAANLYRASQLCVLPFTGSFAGLPAGIAAANRLPIIATRSAGIPDHIGELGLWIDPDDPAQLAVTLKAALADEAGRLRQGERLRAHAEKHLGWDSVARETLDVYRSGLRRAQARRGQPATSRSAA